MRASLRRVAVLVAVVLVVAGVGAFVAMYLHWQASMENVRAPASVPPPGFAPGEVHQLPKIIAHFERDGVVVVVLVNATQRHKVVIDPETDRLIIEHEAESGESPVRHVRRIPLDAPRILAPGERIEPIFVPIGGSRRAVTIWFENRHPNGVHSTGAKIP